MDKSLQRKERMVKLFDVLQNVLIAAIVVGGICFFLFTVSQCEGDRRIREQDNYRKCLEQTGAQTCPCMCDPGLRM